MDEIDRLKQETIIKRSRFRRWNRQQRKQNKRASFYHEFLVSDSAQRTIERIGGEVQGNVVTFSRGTPVFHNGHSVVRGHRFELLVGGVYPSYYSVSS